MKSIRPHPEHHELHGITVAVDTHGAQIYVGRCHDVDAHHVYLVDVDMFVAGADGSGKRAWVEQVARFGPWAKQPRLAVPRESVRWMERLGDIAERGAPDACP